MPSSTAPHILNKSYTVTAEVTIPEGGAEGMIVTQGGRFGGYGLFLSKGVLDIGRSKPVFLYNLLDLKRTTWVGPALGAGKHTIVFDFKSDGPGLGKGGTGVLSVDGKEVANYLYTQREAEALLRGGVHRVWLGNLRAGQHEMTAFFTGKGPHGRDYSRGATLRMDKGVGAKYVELKISDRERQLQPEFVVKEWE